MEDHFDELFESVREDGAIPRRRQKEPSMVPDEETIEAMKAARRDELVTVGTVDDLLADLHESGKPPGEYKVRTE